jgi:hypothetical protein
VSTARASAGTVAWPAGFPVAGTASALGDGLAALGDGPAVDVVAFGEPDGPRQAALAAAVPPHPASSRQVSRPATMAGHACGAGTRRRRSLAGGACGAGTGRRSSAAVREGGTAHTLRCPGEL